MTPIRRTFFHVFAALERRGPTIQDADVFMNGPMGVRRTGGESFL
jgi:hypothetical protein